jgi:predicted SnoaL-like aldol condensation-catalyzing enzyme
MAPAGLRRYLGWIAANFPDACSEVKRVFADEDIVILHVHRVRTPGTLGDAIVDLFQVTDGRIVEHWDVIQPVPETAANNNGMF